MASEHGSISQSHSNVLQTTTPSDRRKQIYYEYYTRCMIVVVFLFLHNTREGRITTVKNGAELSVDPLTTKPPKTRHSPLDHSVAQVTQISNLVAPKQPPRALQQRKGNGKAQFPINQYRLPLVNLVYKSQVLTKLQCFKRRGWPKLKRLGRAIHRNSRRVSLLRAQLSVLQSELEDRTPSRTRSMKTVMCRQKPTELDFIPDRLYQAGLLFVQHYLKNWNPRLPDGNRLDILEIAALLTHHFPCLSA